MRLHGAPAYFHRRGKGRYRPAPPDILAAALAALEKKQRQAEQQQEWVDEMAAGRLPEEIAQAAESLLVRPDKNSQQWKALDAACAKLGKTPDRLLLDLGAWPHALALQRRFLAVNFPRGLAFPTCRCPPSSASCRWRTPRSIRWTTSPPPKSTTRSRSPRCPTASCASACMWRRRASWSRATASSTSWHARCPRSTCRATRSPCSRTASSAPSLDAGRAVPALSLYVTADPETGEVLESETRLERVMVRENLRHNMLDAQVTEASLADPPPNCLMAWLRPLWKLAQALSAQRENVRGKPENNSRVEYSFYLDGNPDDPDTPVRLVPRQRNAPLDRMVAEYMILANNLWGGLLHQHGVPGIYRSQQAGRVRMSTQALPHEAIGVPQYAWSTSPLRRYVDLVNQWQLIAAVEHGVSARLVAPFAARRRPVRHHRRLRRAIRDLGRIPERDGALLVPALAQAAQHHPHRGPCAARRSGALRQRAAGHPRGRHARAGTRHRRGDRHPRHGRALARTGLPLSRPAGAAAQAEPQA